jgi:uncharacterized membrane protein
MSDTPNPPQEPIQPAPPTPQPPAASTPPAAFPATPATAMGDPADVEKNKVMALLSYIGILWLVPLLAAKDSPFAKYHCNQGILLSIAAFGVGMVLGIGSMVLSFIPFIRVVAGCVSCVLFPAFMVAVLVYAILGIMNALNGKLKPLPMFPVVNWVK